MYEKLFKNISTYFLFSNSFPLHFILKPNPIYFNLNNLYPALFL